MPCRRENLSRNDLEELVADIQVRGLPIQDSVIDASGTFWVSFELHPILHLMFVLKDFNSEIYLERTINDRTAMIYRDDETDMLIGNIDFSNIKIRNEHEITFNEFRKSGGLSLETREEAHRRRSNIENLIGRGRSTRLGTNTDSFRIPLYEYTSNECVLEYFERNDLITKRPTIGNSDMMFADLSIEMI